MLQQEIKVEEDAETEIDQFRIAQNLPTVDKTLVHNFNAIDNDVILFKPLGKKSKRGKKTSELPVNDIYKCSHCPYESDSKRDVTKHVCTDNVETIYKCAQCPYKTKRKNDMPKHLLAHCTNVHMYKCPECPYQTKRKCDLPKHLLCHKPMESVPVYQCAFCHYKTKRKGDLPKHVLNHRDKSDLKFFCCTECKYATKRKNDLHKHTLVHSDRIATGVFKCLKCIYATDKVNKFSKHVLSYCKSWADPISMEHLMLEDILANVDNDEYHVVLDDEGGEEEEDQVPMESNVTVDVSEKPGVFRFSVGEFTIDLDAANPPSQIEEREVNFDRHNL